MTTADVTPSSPPGTTRRDLALLRVLCGYPAALLLPWLGLRLSIHLPGLRPTPLALSFILMAAIAIFAGLGPGIVAAVSAAILFNHEVLAPPAFLSFTLRSSVHTLVALCIGLLVVFLCERQRITSRRLNLTIASLQARTDSLVEAQQASNSAAWMFTTGYRILHWAAGGSPIFGRPFSDFSSLDAILAAILEEDRTIVVAEFGAALAAGHPFRQEFRVRWPSGEIHWLETRGTPSAADPGVWHGVTIDVTERKNAEAALVRSEKLAAIGRLSATVAHEVNNPLEAVTNLLYLAMADPALPPSAGTWLQQADRELSRLATIARRTLTFVRPRTSSGPVNVVEIVESVVAMFQPRCAARGADLRILRDGELILPVPADDLRQILTNLVSNACDALPPAGGRIEVEIARDDSRAALAVRDNGAGIAPENLTRIFDPFFTTKEDTGTGIGLWLTRDLVEKNGGRISVHIHDLPPGFRTLFHIEFPLPPHP